MCVSVHEFIFGDFTQFTVRIQNVITLYKRVNDHFLVKMGQMAGGELVPR